MRKRYGFIHEKLEIKILILFILRRLPEPVSMDELTELTMCDDGISYFDFTECLKDLVYTEHICWKDGKYSITEKGERNGRTTENSLPFSVRALVENTSFAHRNRQNRNSMIKTLHSSNSDGSYTVSLSLSDGLGEIVSIQLFAASEQQALSLEKGFRESAESVYNRLIETILS